MKNEHDESKKVVLGICIGALVGAGALYCIQAATNQKTPVLKKIGRTISEVGEMLEHSNMMDTGSDMLHRIEQKLPASVDLLSSLTDWVSTGMSLWKKLK